MWGVWASLAAGFRRKFLSSWRFYYIIHILRQRITILAKLTKREINRTAKNQLIPVSECIWNLERQCIYTIRLTEQRIHLSTKETKQLAVIVAKDVLVGIYQNMFLVLRFENKI